MTGTEILTAFGTVLGAAGASYGVSRIRRKPTADAAVQVAEQEKRLSKIEVRSSQNREDIRRILDRAAPPDLSARVDRLEDDVRQAAADAAERYSEILMILGEVRGTLDALKGGGE